MAALSFQSLGTRAAILLCFWSAILVSIPYWLRFTTIQRLPLPKAQVQALETAATCPLLFHTTLQVFLDRSLVVEHENAFLRQVEALIRDSLQMKERFETGTSLDCVEWNINTYLADEHSLNTSLAFDPEQLSYIIHVVPDSYAVSTSLSPMPIVRIADPQQGVLPDAVSAAVVARILKLRGDTPLSIESSGSSTAVQDPRIIQYSRHVRLVFSIMNQDISSGTAYDSALLHDLARSTSKFNPINSLLKELSDLHDFHVESQVQWYAPLHFTPTQEKLEEVVEVETEEIFMVDEEFEEDEETSTVTTEVNSDEEEAEVDALLPVQKRKVIRQIPRVQKVVRQTRTPLPTRHVVEWDDLKVFVNSAEWSLISTVPPPESATTKVDKRSFDQMSHTHDLHFLLYVPSQSNSPLLLRAPGSKEVSEANAWLIPQWGGVVILNPPNSTSSDVALTTTETSTSKNNAVLELPASQVEDAIALFAKQLRTLLGLGSEASTTDASNVDVTADEAEQLAQLANKVQLQILFQRRILEIARETVNTLGGIVRLVDKIENLGVGPDVQHDVQLALKTLHSLCGDESTDNGYSPAKVTKQLSEVLDTVQSAHALANRAFFNPDMLALLYFPDEHKYAVYTPLFGPLLVPLVVTTIKLVKSVLATSRKVKLHTTRSARSSM